MTPAITLENVTKRFVMHLRGGSVLEVVSDVNFVVHPGECVVLGGPSGTGKSSVLKMIYGNYRADFGRIDVAATSGTVDIAKASPREILALRQTTLGYVSQFLRVIPRIDTLDIVAASARDDGASLESAREQAAAILARLNIPQRLWHLAPATFSGGEQQRVNIARGFIAKRPILLLDEPTASLDSRNRATVVDLIKSEKRAGAAIVGIFHDEDVRGAIADRIIDITQFTGSKAA